MRKITLIKGDGIGPEIIDVTLKVLEKAGFRCEWEERVAGERALKEYGNPLPDETLDSMKNNGVTLKGPLTTPVGKGFKSVNVALRQELDLFVNMRPVKSFKGVKSCYEDVDIVVFRENTEEFYAGIEHYVDPRRTIAESIGVVSKVASERIIRYAFEYAKRNNRKKVTVVHKANILKLTSGLFLKTAEEVAEEYPEIEMEAKIVDNMCMQLVMNPLQFDVIVTTNLFGDIISDLTAGLVGGLGFAPSANIGYDVAVFEPVHGSAPDIAGKNLANPVAMILSACLMLDYLGENAISSRVRKAIEKVLEEGIRVTRDVNPENFVGTKEMGEEICRKLEQ